MVEENSSMTYAGMIAGEETGGCSTSEVRMLLGLCYTIVQFIMVTLAIICLIKGLLNIINNRKINKVEEIEDDDENNSEIIEEEIDKEDIEKKKPVLPFFIAAGVMGWIGILIEIISNFAAKPIIYIYPEEETKVKVKVSNTKKLTCTYPKYEDGWEVLAKPNGDLIDLKTNRKLYALYWEGINTTKSNFKEGFIVKGEEVAKFLEEKLEILGLNEREAEEFIVYWLPLMEKNKYNFVRFETIDEINENLKLEITPAPETLIRINMEFKGLSRPIEVEEQELERRERKGYTVVEWGGTKL